jgi:hypothetical protein
LVIRPNKNAALVEATLVVARQAAWRTGYAQNARPPLRCAATHDHRVGENPEGEHGELQLTLFYHNSPGLQAAIVARAPKAIIMEESNR